MQPQFIPTFSDAGSLSTPLPPEPQPQNSASEPETEDEQEPVEPEVVESEAVDTEPVDDIEGLGIVDVPPISDEDLIADLGLNRCSPPVRPLSFRQDQSVALLGMRPTARPGKSLSPTRTGRRSARTAATTRSGGRRQFTLPLVKDILMASHRRGNVEPEELKQIPRRIYIARQGGKWRRDEGWHLVNVGAIGVGGFIPTGARCATADG